MAMKDKMMQLKKFEYKRPEIIIECQQNNQQICNSNKNKIKKPSFGLQLMIKTIYENPQYD